MMAIRVTTTESSGGEEDDEEEGIMTNLVESKVDTSDDEEVVLVDGLPETAVDDDEDDELDVDEDDSHVVHVTDVDGDDEEVFVVQDTVSTQSSTESNVSTDNQYYTLSDLLDLITGITPGVTDHLMEEFLVAYKFLLTDHRLTSVLPQLNQGGCQCVHCMSNPTKLLVRHLIQRSCSFDLLLRLTLVWVNCFFNDFDGNFNYTRKILVRLKQIQLYQNQPPIELDVHCPPLPSHPPPPLDKMDSDVDDNQNEDESDDTFDFEDMECDTTPRIESSLDLVLLALSLKSTIRKVPIPVESFTRVTFDLGIDSNFASSNSHLTPNSAASGSCSSTLQPPHQESSDENEVTIGSKCTSNGLDSSDSVIRLVFDPVTGRVFVGCNVKDTRGDCCDSILLREGDRLISIDDTSISYTSLTNSPELEFKAVRELESRIANCVKGHSSGSNTSSSSSSSSLSNCQSKLLLAKTKYDPFAYNTILKRIRKRKLICNKRHSISSSISSYSTGYHSSVTSNSRLTHPHFHSTGHHHHGHHGHHHHHAHGHGLSLSSTSSPTSSTSQIANSSCTSHSTNSSYSHHSLSNVQSSGSKSELEALQIFNAFKDGREHLLLVDEKKTNAREVVMILARDLFLSAASSLNTNSSFDQIRRKASLAALLSPSSGGQSNSGGSASGQQAVAGLFSSLDFALYELTVSYTPASGVIVRSRRISDTATNLWSSRSIFSRLLLKQIAKNSSVVTSSANLQGTNEDEDGDSNSFENRIRKELVESYLKVKNKRAKVSTEDEDYNPISLTDVEPMVLALELTYHAFRLFSALDAQSILSSILTSSNSTGGSSSTRGTNTLTNNGNGKNQSASCLPSNSGQSLSPSGSRNAEDFICASKVTTGLEAWESLTEAEMFWAINEILRQPTSEDRVKCVKVLIKTAIICLSKLRNFSTAASITSALEHASIKRLKKTLWQPLKKKHKNLTDDLYKLNQVLDPSKNMAFYRRSILEAVKGHFEQSRNSHNSNERLSVGGGAVTGANTLTLGESARYRSLSATGHSLFNDLRSSMSKSKTSTSSGQSNSANCGNGSLRKIVIPWYPVHKKDLTFFHITQDTLDKTDPSRINWTKIRSIVSKLRELLSYSCESPSSNKPYGIDDALEIETSYGNGGSGDMHRNTVSFWYEPVPRRSYPYIEVIGDYKHPMTPPCDSSDSSKEIAKKVHSFMSKEKLTKEFLHNSFFKPNCILFNEELLMKKSLDLETAPVSTSSTVTKTSTSGRTVNITVSGGSGSNTGNPQASTSVSTCTAASVSITSQARSNSQMYPSGSLNDLKRAKASTTGENSVPSLESMNCNFHGILSGQLKHSMGPIGRTIPTSKFGVTDETQLNKLMALTTNSTSKSSSKAGKHHHHHQSHSAHHSHHHQQQPHHQHQHQHQPLQQPQQQQQPQPQQQYTHHLHQNTNLQSTMDHSILAPNALYPAQSSSSSSSTCSSASLHHSFGSNANALLASANLTLASSAAPAGNLGHRTLGHKPCAHHSGDHLSRESSSLGPAFRYPESAHLPSLATARTTSTASFSQQPRAASSQQQPVKGPIILPPHHHRHHHHLQQATTGQHHRHHQHSTSSHPKTVSSSSASSTRDSSPLASFEHSNVNVICTDSSTAARNVSDLNLKHASRSSSIETTQMLPSYEETIANLRAMRVTPLHDPSSNNLSPSSNPSRQRSTSCPRRSNRKENLV